MRPARSARALVTAVIAGAMMAASALPASASGVPTRPAAPSWQVTKSVPGNAYLYFSAVVSIGFSNAWAFEQVPGKAPVAWELNGTAWSKQPFPGQVNETVISVSATSGADIWAFTSANRVLYFNGTTWAAMKKFGKPIGSGMVVTPTDVWVFGEPYSVKNPTTWHYNGSGWKPVTSASGLFGASSLSAKSIWAYGPTRVAHFTGSTWKSTSVVSLLPRPSSKACGPSSLTAIDAISETSVYATATDNCPDGGGVLGLLHYNGTRWSKLAIRKTYGVAIACIDDGLGGVWIPLVSGNPGSASMVHYSGGKLTTVTLPYRPQHLWIYSASSALGTGAAFAAGLIRKSLTARTTTAVILRYA
jgi:hypothetical protein